MAKRKRRSFTKEYKAEVVELIRKSGKNIAAVARDLDLGETAVRRWVEQAEIDSGGGPAGALTTAVSWPGSTPSPTTSSSRSNDTR
jgi:transposase